MLVFGKYSSYYNLIYKDKDYSSETEYVHNLIQEYYCGAKSVLDLGCGTGMHDFLLAEKGYAVTGVDRSEDMLAVANSQLACSILTSTLTFKQGDIRTMRLNERFDAVISLFHVMSYQTTNEALYQSFSNAHKHLNDGGVFLFDFWYGPAVLTDMPSVRVKRLEDSEILCYRIATPILHPNENIVDVNYEVLIEDKKAGKVEKLNEIHRMRYLFIPEIEFMFKDIGFRKEKHLEWMSYDKALSFKSWNGLVVAKKV